MKILHIANWYPSKPTPFNAPWIRNHINSISDQSENVVYHIEVRKGSMKINYGKNNDNSTYFMIGLFFEIWRIYEILSFILVLWILIINKNKKFDIINFHIAYPNCTYLQIIKKWIKFPIIITEHWSAYHYNFNIKYPEKRNRIQRIFRNNIPVISVSNSLINDIKAFSKAEFPYFVIPNIVNTQVFKYQLPSSKINKKTFFMVSQWKWPKEPFIVIEAWRLVIQNFPSMKLKIGGYGPQLKKMDELIKDLNLMKNIEFFGNMKQEKIAEEMQSACAFIHCSEYETFSVVCAEALCCGTPVIASNVGGITEYVNKKNGILVEENKSEKFSLAIVNCYEKNYLYNRKLISKEASNNFSEKRIGTLYYETLSSIILN